MEKSKNRGEANGRYIPRPPGKKRCRTCQTVKPLCAFHIDRSRFDGHSYVCRACRDVRRMPGPTKPERRAAAEKGLRWCSGCKAWLDSGRVTKQGTCRPCENTAVRARYAGDPEFHQRVIGHSMKRRASVAPIPAEIALSIFEDFDGECAYCNAPASTWDHVVAVSRGGLTEPYNIVPACRRCNSSKRDADVWEWLAASGRTIKDQAVDRLTLYHTSFYLAQGPAPF